MSSWRAFFREVNSLRWYDTVTSFVFRFMAKTSEPLLAAGIIVSAIDFLQKGELLAGNAHLAFAWSCAQGIAMEVSVGPVLVCSLDAKEEGDQLKAKLYGSLSVLLAVVGGAMLFLQFCASIAGINESQLNPYLLYILFLFRTVASIGYIALSCTKHKRFSRSVTPSVETAVSTQMDDLRTATERRYQELAATVQQQEAQTAERMAHLFTEVKELFKSHSQEVTAQLSELRSRPPEKTPKEETSSIQPTPKEEPKVTAEFDKRLFVRECLIANPDITIAEIQRKAQEVGQSIATSYISDVRKAFRSEQAPKPTNGNGNGHSHIDLNELVIVAQNGN